jgi:hypothetical protein
MAALPPRTATDEYFARMAAHGVRRELDVVFDVDLGELVEGHHVIARGLERAATGAVLHYEFVPGPGKEANLFAWYWMLAAEDDLGTRYETHNSGAFDPHGGDAVHGVRDLGGQIPADAAWVRLRLTPPQGWTPPEPWAHVLEIDLNTGTALIR